MTFIFPCLIYFTWCDNLSVRSLAAYNIISFLLWLSNIPLCIYFLYSPVNESKRLIQECDVIRFAFKKDHSDEIYQSLPNKPVSSMTSGKIKEVFPESLYCC